MKQFYNYSPRLLFHYENVIRPDLLLKCNYKNIMEVPFLREIKIIAYINMPSLEAQGRLALEILSGACLGRINIDRKRAKKVRSYWGSHDSPQVGSRGRGSSCHKKTSGVQTISLKGKLMYLFLDKIITIRSAPPVNLKKEASVTRFPLLPSAPTVVSPSHGFINIRLNFSELYLLPEVAWHSSLFESISAIDLSIATSAKSLEETNLLWSGFMEKKSLIHHV